MRKPGFKPIKKGIRWIRSRITGGALILGYHRITEDRFDPYSVRVSVANFRSHLEVLKEQAQVLSLQALIDGLRDGEVPPRSVVITFDDGYADNLVNAKPLLEQFQVPATIFVASGYIGGRFWWDILADAVFSQDPVLEGLVDRVESALDITLVNGRGRRPSGDEKMAVLLSLYRHLLRAPNADRELVLAYLDNLDPHPGQITASRALTSGELAGLAREDMFEIGSHTVSHPILTNLPVNEQRFEIVESRKQIYEITGAPISSFSCPNGSWSEEVREILAEAGYRCACVSENDVVTAGSDPFKLPRFWVGDWGKDRFAGWFRRWGTRV